MATISSNNQPSVERVQVETLLSIRNLCDTAAEHYANQSDDFSAGIAEAYGSVVRYIDEIVEGISAATGLDLQVVRDEMEKQNQNLSDV